MSHKLFRHSILSNARVWSFLKRVDAAEAEAYREAGCPRCGGELHSARYPRKPHGLAADLGGDVRRFSFCCAVCRRRVTPPSVRFFGRRFRVAPLFLLMSALVLAGGARLEAIGRKWGDPVADAAPLAAVVARDLPGDAGVAGEAGRAGGAARGGAAAPAAAHHAGLQLPLAVVAQPGLVDAVDRLLRARRRAGFSRRKRFCHERIGRSTSASPRHGQGGMPGWAATTEAVAATGGRGCASR